MEPESDGGAFNSPSPTDQVHSNRKKTFAETIAPSTHGVHPSARFFKTPGGERPGEEGKSPTMPSNSFCILPNDEMLKEIISKKSRLSDTAIFFACVNIEKCPPRKFLDDWFHHLWNLKLGLNISFYRQV